MLRGPANLNSSKSPTPGWLAGAMLGVATFVLFWPATECQFIEYDDPDYVTSNPLVQQGLTFDTIKAAFTGIVSANWHPLTMLSHCLDCQVFGTAPWGHHLTSILLHSANTILVFALLRRMTGAFWPTWFAAAFFGLSPLRVESVVWVAERKDVLSGFFGLLVLLFYVCYVQEKESTRQKAENGEQKAPPRKPNADTGRSSPSAILRPPSSFAYRLSLFCFALGLMSKPMLVTWPFLMLVLDYWPLGRFPHLSSVASAKEDHVSRLRLLRRLVGEKIPFFVLALVSCIVTYFAQRHEGAMQMTEHLPVQLRCENILISLCRYLGKILWPSDLAVLYPFPRAYPLAAALGAGALLAAISVTVWLGRRRRPYWLAGWLWYAGTLVPVIGLVSVGYQSMADRYTYLPSIGFSILAIWSLTELAVTCRGLLVPLLVGAGTYFIVIFAVCHHQITHWRNSETLFQHTLAVTRDNFVIHNNLGTYLLEQGRIEAAIGQFQAALRGGPDYTEFHKNLGLALDRKGLLDQALGEYEKAARLNPNAPDIQHVWGVALAKLGRYDEAIQHLHEALRLRPNHANTHIDLGDAWEGKGRADEAIREYQEAVRLQPANAPAHRHLGTALGNQGNLTGAARELATAVRLNARDPSAHFNLGIILLKMGTVDTAITQFQEAVRLDPGDAVYHKNLGTAMDQKGRIENAIQEYREALRLKPELTAVHAALGADCVKLGNSEEAVNQLRTALNSDPDDANTHNDLGNALDGKGQTDEAIQEYREAIRLQPTNAPAHSNLGAAYGKKGELEEAIAELRAAARLQGDDPLTFYNLGMALYQKGQTNEAIRQLSQALRVKPDFDAARKALDQMQTP